jgi:tetratricopeptide (TPR) repeat protein
VNRKERRRANARSGRSSAPNMLAANAPRGSVELRAAFAEAMAALEMRQVDKAEMLFRRVLLLDPNEAQAHNWLGVLCQNKGESAKALQHLKQAAALGPMSAELANNFGIVYLAIGNFDAAQDHFEKAISLNPRLPAAHYSLGLVHKNRHQPEPAIAQFKKAVALAPDYTAARMALADVLGEYGRKKEAEAQYEKIVAYYPSPSEAHRDLAIALYESGRLDEAAFHLREVFTHVPWSAEGFNKTGVMCANLGRFDEAVTYFKSALAMKPDFADALYRMATYSKELSNQNGVARIKSLLAIERPAEERVLLHFALGKIFDDLGDYAHAFGSYRAGNEILDAAAGFDEVAWESKIDRLIAAFTADFFAARSSFENPSRQPIFIFGMPRSGTTLVEQIIAAHPEVAAGGELPTVPAIVESLPKRFGLRNSFPECVTSLGKDDIDYLSNSYLAYEDVQVGNAARVTDKLPNNFLHLGLLALMFPKAHYIHCRRDPMDTCLSCYFTKLESDHPYASNLRKLGRYYRGYGRLMVHWRTALPVSMLEIDYESVVADQTEASHRIIAHCGLDWDDRCLSFHRGTLAVRTASVWQARQPLYKTAVGRWRQYESFLGSLRAALRDPGG